MAKASDRGRTRLARLLRFVRGHRTAVVAVQDHPDPDGIACAAALKLLLEEKARLDVTLAANGDPIISGHFARTITFGSATLTGCDNYEAFVTRYEATSGKPAWVTRTAWA